MTQEDKELLLKDLCARLSYGVKAKVEGHYDPLVIDGISKLSKSTWAWKKGTYVVLFWNDTKCIDMVKPYLRPMSSMTSEEWCEYCDSCAEDEKEAIITHKGYRIVPTTHKEHFFNIHHFDYRWLIEKGLALEAPKEMYKTE